MLKTSVSSTYKLQESFEQELNFGPLTLWLICQYGELWVAWGYPDQTTSEKPEKPDPEDDDWQRFTFDKSDKELIIKPVFPDRPVVLTPEKKLILSKGNRAQIYTRCPLWLRLSVKGKDEVTLLEVPSFVLSSTWFGSFAEGLVGYRLKTGARRTPLVDETKPHMAICPIHLKNTSDEELLVENICLRVGELTLFQGKAAYWASETKVAYRGKNNIAKLQFESGPPKEIKDAVLISEPREGNKSFAAKTFASFLSFSGFGDHH